MKKYICMILAVVMIAATLAACGSNETKKVATDGSTSMEKMIGPSVRHSWKTPAQPSLTTTPAPVPASRP